MRKKLTPEIVEQYRMVQRRIDAQRSAGLSDEEFLRASNVRVIVEPEVERYLDQTVELLNGTNELNYTKRRIKTEEDIAELRKSLQTFGFHAGCVFAVDNHGDYGLIGFFLLRRRAGINQLIHYTFSCRIMNMGIEQYVYEMLGRPKIAVTGAVTYGLQTHEKIDWINLESPSNTTAVGPQQSLVLLGGCDLLQLATYCGGNREEFVNKVKDGVKVRYDNPAFILAERESIRNSGTIGKIPFWTYEDATRFDAAVGSAKLVLVSLWRGTGGIYFRTSDKLLLHMGTESYKQIKRKKARWLKKHFEKQSFEFQDHLKLIVEALGRLGQLCSTEARIFVLGCLTFDDIGERSLEMRQAYNGACRDYCADHGTKFTFVDVNGIVPREALIDRVHFTRQGYFTLAKYIVNAASNSGCSTAFERHAELAVSS